MVIEKFPYLKTGPFGNPIFLQICKEDPVYLRSFFAWKKNKDIILFKPAKLFGPFLTVCFSLKN